MSDTLRLSTGIDRLDELLGKIRDGARLRRAMYIAKHRGSACSDRIIPFHIDERGIRIESLGAGRP